MMPVRRTRQGNCLYKRIVSVRFCHELSGFAQLAPCGELPDNLSGWKTDLIDARELHHFVAQFPDDRKSRELVLQLLEHTPAPFSRKQFQPGHITFTGLVLHPFEDSFVLVYHRRLDRWLLPGGHVEEQDVKISDTARREVLEETGAQITSNNSPSLIGIDVHGIPPGRGEPFHLHHDLIFALQSTSADVAPTEEVRKVVWCSPNDWERFDLPDSIRSCARRAIQNR
jgi:8-oxo-dGTP pyrophosphatase MutT (NUDIX family)